MAAALEDDVDPTYTHFAHRVEFLALLARLIAINLERTPSVREDDEEEKLVGQLGAILDFYLPLPGLLDPSLHEIVPPLMAVLSTTFSTLAKADRSAAVDESRLHRLGKMLNWVVKVRGWKAIIPYFPSGISNLPILITLLSPPRHASSSITIDTPHHPLLSGQDAWELRAVALLWLALLLTVPFNLSALSSEDPSPPLDSAAHRALFKIKVSPIASQVIRLTLPLLHKPGKEGSYAALVLARLYSRSDAVDALPGFFEWARMELDEGDRESEASFVAALFELLAVLPSLVAQQHLDVLERFTNDTLLPHLRGTRTATSSGLVRKLAVKARGRWWIARLGHVQKSGDTTESDDMPEGLEEQLDELMNGLSDKDTIVRYSCAKYLARISALLPSSFADQIVLATISLFSGTDDEPVVETPFGYVVDPGGNASSEGTMGFGGLENTKGEARWHGCCLAIAEMARRGLIRDEEAISQSVHWALRALLFDLRRASHSIGANVRDAAAYLVWSLSRACSPSTIAPFANDLAAALISVACFDREVGVRRAASAAFQEGVGRLGLYPEGIDVLGKTDFYSVSVKRIAFTTAAPAVAVHAIYRDRMREHLHQITLRHWDLSMRDLGASALQRMLELGSSHDLQDSIDREIKAVPSLDPTSVHGALAALARTCDLLEPSDERRRTILHAVSTIRPAALVSAHGAYIIEAACDLITATLSPVSIDAPVLDQLVFHYLDLVMKRKEADCYEAGGRMVRRLSELRAAEDVVHRLLVMVQSSRTNSRQVGALVLGCVQYSRCESQVGKAIEALLYQGEDKAKADVETRRYAIRSLASIVRLHSKGDESVLLDRDQFNRIFARCLAALSDYSTDQRGDVGSWVRMDGIKALSAMIHVAAHEVDPMFWITQDQFEQAMGGILKLGLEKLEPVRAAAWRAWLSLRRERAEEHWRFETAGIWDFNAKDESDESFRYIDLNQWYLSAMPALRTSYHVDVVAGLIHSAGSQVQSLSATAFAALREYALAAQDTTNIVLADLQHMMTANLNVNRTFMPSLVTATKIFMDDKLHAAISGYETVLGIVSTAGRGIPQFKSMERISASMKLVVAMLAMPDERVYAKAVDLLPLFLTHRFPRIRSTAAEALYLQLSDLHDDLDPELESLLLETSWTDESIGAGQAARVVEIMRTRRGAEA